MSTTREEALISLRASLRLAESEGGPCEIPRYRMAEIVAALSSCGATEPIEECWAMHVQAEGMTLLRLFPPFRGKEGLWPRGTSRYVAIFPAVEPQGEVVE